MTDTAELALMVRRQVETYRSQGRPHADALALVRQTYAEIIVRRVTDEKAVPNDILLRYGLVYDWEAGIVPYNCDSAPRL